VSGRDAFDQVADSVMHLQRMAKASITVHCIFIPSPDSGAHNYPRRLKLGDDTLDGALCNTDACGDVFQASFGVSDQADQDMGMIC